jgi:nicotinamidase-related amidase
VNGPVIEKHRLRDERMALLIVDFQERLAAVMPEAERISCERHISLLLELARRQGWPVVVSEQYPQGLGPTAATIASGLSAPGVSTSRFEKTHFSCTNAPAFKPIFSSIFEQAERHQWIVTGMEAHVCVYQTVRGLLRWGATVHVPADAVVSRTLANKNAGLQLIRELGAVVTVTETVLFDALGVSGTDDFRAISKLIK